MSLSWRTTVYLLGILVCLHCNTTPLNAANSGVVSGSGGSDGATVNLTGGTATLNQPANTTCNITLSLSDQNDTDDFQMMVEAGAVFVYVKLEFPDNEFDDPVSAYLSDIDTVIDPLTWVWSRGDKGTLLLASPFDFGQLSLTTLSNGVFTVTVKIESSDCIDASADVVSDEEKIEAIAGFLHSVLSVSYNEEGDKPVVCLGKQLRKQDLPLPGVGYFPGSSYSMLQVSAAYDCWQPQHADSLTDLEMTRITTKSWLGLILAGGVVLALFSPLALSFFLPKQKPGRYIGLDSDLPLGFKYVVCFWKNDNICVVTLRWIIFIVIFLLIQYIPVLISFVTDMNDFMRRSQALYRVGPLGMITSLVSHLLINLIFVISCIILLERLLRRAEQSFLEPFLRERGRSSSDDSANNQSNHTPTENVAYKYLVFVDAPVALWAPETKLESTRAFFFYMRFRMGMAFDIEAWKFVLFGYLWQYVGSPHPSLIRKTVSVIIFVVLYPVYLPFALLFFAFNSVPLLYCMTRCFQAALGTVSCSQLMFCLLICIASIAWFFKFVATFVYLAEIISYLFMGFVVNSEIVGPTVIVLVIILGYVITTITGFYDGYCDLFSEIIEIAEQVPTPPPSSSPLSSSPSPVCQTQEQPRQQTRETSDSSIEMSGHLVSPTTHPLIPNRLVINNDRNVPQLDLGLFWAIVEKHRPLRLKVASTLFQLLVMAFGVAAGMSILSLVGSLSELNSTVELFASVIIAGVVPLVLLAFKSPASQNCYDKATKILLEADISYYAEHRLLKDQ